MRPIRAALVRTSPAPTQVLPLYFHPDQYLRQLGVGGWQEVAHPRAKSTTEWVGTSLHRVTLDLYLDSGRSGHAANIEADLALLYSWGRPVDSADPLAEPPQVQVRYGHGQQLRWVINDIVAVAEYREADESPRVAAELTVDLLEYVSGEPAFSPIADASRREDGVAVVGAIGLPAVSAARGVAQTAGTRTYTVRAGDDLSSIAARELGNANRWREIADLNSLADPDLIVVGQVLTLPAS